MWTRSCAPASGDVEPGVGHALRELGGVELVLRGLDGGRLALGRGGGDEAQPERARHLALRRELGDALAHDRVLAQRLAVALLAAHVVDQLLEALLDRREREHREALEIEGLRDVLEAAAALADQIVVGHEHVVEEDGVRALVADRGRRLDRETRVAHRDQEQADAVMFWLCPDPCVRRASTSRRSGPRWSRSSGRSSASRPGRAPP